MAPRVSIVGVVLPDRSPLALREIGTPEISCIRLRPFACDAESQPVLSSQMGPQSQISQQLRSCRQREHKWGQGLRTPTGLTAQTILSRVRLPIPPRPLRHSKFQSLTRPLWISDLVTASQQSLLTLTAYGVLAGLYLLVVPLGLFLWMSKRWHHMEMLTSCDLRIRLSVLPRHGSVRAVPICVGGQGEV